MADLSVFFTVGILAAILNAVAATTQLRGVSSDDFVVIRVRGWFRLLKGSGIVKRERPIKAPIAIDDIFTTLELLKGTFEVAILIQIPGYITSLVILWNQVKHRIGRVVACSYLCVLFPLGLFNPV